MFICPNLPPLANLVKYQEIQEKLLLEIKGAAGDGDESVKEDDFARDVIPKIVCLGLR